MARALRRTLLVALTTLIVVTLLSGSRLFLSLETLLEHTWFKYVAVPRANDRVVIVEIDDATLDSYGGRLGRDQLALLLEELSSPGAGAKTIVLDLYFEGEDRYFAANDTLLAAVLWEKRERIVNALYLPVGKGIAPTREPSNFQGLGRFGYEGEVPGVPAASTAELPIDLLLESFGIVGHVDVWLDPEGVPVEIPMFVQTGDVRIPAIALEATRVFETLPRDSVTVAGKSLSMGRYRVPLGDGGSARIPYSRNPDAYARFSMLQVLAGLQGSANLSDAFRDKLVIVGYNAPKYHPAENIPTPFGHRRPGVRIHADMISGILDGSLLRTLPGAVSQIAGVLAALLFSLLIVVRHRLLRPLLGIAGLAALLAADALMFRAGIVVNAVPALVIGAVLVTYTGLQTVQEQRLIIREQGQVVEHLRLKESSLARLEMELAVAKAVQKNLLPDAAPRLDHYEVVGSNEAAREVGGDFFDFVSLSASRVLITLGDVSGKGVPASLLMATCQAIIRSECHLQGQESCNLASLVSRVNDLLASTVEPGNFVTLFTAILDSKAHTLEYCGAGHNPPLLISAAGEVTELMSQGLILGAMPGMSYQSTTVPMHVGHTLIVYSDGLVEASSPADEEFGMERLAALGRRNREQSAGQQLEALEQAVGGFCEGYPAQDDLTLVVVKRID